MRKYLYSFLCTLLLMPTYVYAYGVDIDGGTITIEPPDTPTEALGLSTSDTLGNEIQSFSDVLTAGWNWLFYIGYIVIVITVICGGVMVAMSAGKPNQRETAKDIIITALKAAALMGGIHIIIAMAFSFFSF